MCFTSHHIRKSVSLPALLFCALPGVLGYGISRLTNSCFEFIYFTYPHCIQSRTSHLFSVCTEPCCYTKPGWFSCRGCFNVKKVLLVTVTWSPRIKPQGSFSAIYSDFIFCFKFATLSTFFENTYFHSDSDHVTETLGRQKKVFHLMCKRASN